MLTKTVRGTVEVGSGAELMPGRTNRGVDPRWMRRLDPNSWVTQGRMDAGKNIILIRTLITQQEPNTVLLSDSSQNK
jgi:hypothetical protein